MREDRTTGCAVQASSEGTSVGGVELDTTVPEAATFGEQCAAAGGTSFFTTRNCVGISARQTCSRALLRASSVSSASSR